MSEALMAKPQHLRTQPFNPLGRSVTRNDANSRQDPPNFAISAALSSEDDFEIGGEFLDVFVRAGERVAGFLAGCILIAGVWIICTAL
jgi:hypothetical protein